jgi:hypothetical protein
MDVILQNFIYPGILTEFQNSIKDFADKEIAEHMVYG